MSSVRRRTPVRPLLAVAAASLVACGSSAVQAPISADPAAATTTSPPAPTAAPTPVATAATAATAGPAAATPRVMSNGRPACGNVNMRTTPDCDPR